MLAVDKVFLGFAGFGGGGGALSSLSRGRDPCPSPSAARPERLDLGSDEARRGDQADGDVVSQLYLGRVPHCSGAPAVGEAEDLLPRRHLTTWRPRSATSSVEGFGVARRACRATCDESPGRVEQEATLVVARLVQVLTSQDDPARGSGGDAVDL